METIKRILRSLKPYRGKIAAAMFLQLIVIATRLVSPYVTKTVVNDVIEGGKYDLLYPLCALILLLAAARVTSAFGRGMLYEHVSQNYAWDLRTRLYAHLEEMPYEFYDKHRVGEIMSRMTGDLDGIRNLIAYGFNNAFDNALCFVGSLIFMLSMSWQVTLMVLVVSPLIAFMSYRFRNTLRPIFREMREQNAVLNTRTQENLAGMHVVKAFVREGYEEEEFKKKTAKSWNMT